MSVNPINVHPSILSFITLSISSSIQRKHPGTCSSKPPCIISNTPLSICMSIHPSISLPHVVPWPAPGVIFRIIISLITSWLLLCTFDFYKVPGVFSSVSNSRTLVDVSFLAPNTVTFHLMYKAITVFLSFPKQPPVCDWALHSSLSQRIVLGAIIAGTRRLCAFRPCSLCNVVFALLAFFVEKTPHRAATETKHLFQTHLPASTRHQPERLGCQMLSLPFIILTHGIDPHCVSSISVYTSSFVELFNFFYFSVRCSHPTLKCS